MSERSFPLASASLARAHRRSARKSFGNPRAFSFRRGGIPCQRSGPRARLDGTASERDPEEGASDVPAAGYTAPSIFTKHRRKFRECSSLLRGPFSSEENAHRNLSLLLKKYEVPVDDDDEPPAFVENLFHSPPCDISKIEKVSVVWFQKATGSYHHVGDILNKWKN